MTTLVDREIIAWAEAEGVEPFKRSAVNPASLNLRLGWRAMVEGQDGRMIQVDLRGRDQASPFRIAPGEWFLAETLERIDIPPTMEAEVCLRSSAARAGFDHCLAGYVDPGYQGRLTLEFVNCRRFADLWIYPGQELVQLRLRRLESAPIWHYGQTGRYQGDDSVRGCADPNVGRVEL